jgi:hypothetical protein
VCFFHWATIGLPLDYHWVTTGLQLDRHLPLDYHCLL